MKKSSSPPRPEFDGPAYTRLFQEELLARIQARLAQTPGAVELQVESAHLLAELQRPQEAAQVYQQAIKFRAPKYPLSSRAYSILPFTGKTLPITALLLVSPEWGNAPFRKYLDSQTFLTLQVIADYHDAGLSLPSHQLVINCVSDADACQASLAAASALLARTDAPRINPPEHILATTRESNARRLASLPGVRTPKVATFSRQSLSSPNAEALLARHGFSFPLLARAPGFHTGLHFIRAETPQELTAAMASFPGDDVTILEFLDARGADGLIRKFRVMMINGKLYPVHVAVSQDWKVHFFSSTTPDSAEHRGEDRKFLENMPAALGARVVETLSRIQEALKLDYAGIDFSIDADGNVLVFEANATMNINPPEADELLAYRRTPVQRIADAVRALFFHRAFSRPGGAPISPGQILRESALQQLESRLTREPGRIDLQIERARLLIAMERHTEAKNIFMSILAKEPTHVVALNNLGGLLGLLSYHDEAQKIYRAVVALSPDDLKARLSLAQTLQESGELAEARLHYEAALRIAPDHGEAHKGLAYVLRYLQEKELALEHQKKASRVRPALSISAREQEHLPRILIWSSPCGGNSPIMRYLDKAAFPTFQLIPDFYDPSEPLPPHQLVINAVGDADYCEPSFDPLVRLLERETKPVINRPDRVRATGRVENARLLGALEGVVTPRIVTLPREALSGAEGLAALEQNGFTFPVLLRTPGHHGGKNFVRVENPAELAAAVATLPGRNQMVIQFLDARDDDGKIRKYRVMMIDGKLHPLHKAVSSKWMIHYFSAEMTDSAAHRAEDEAFLADMPAVLGTRAMRALEKIRDALGLDYAGADFSLGRQGEVLLFEANATMAVPVPPAGEIWDYRRRHVERIHDAVRAMVRNRIEAAQAR